MFLDYYHLREQPFGVTPDPRFLYLSPTHREALASLYYGVEASRGFLALIAEPGMGKTTLLFQLMERVARVRLLRLSYFRRSATHGSFSATCLPIWASTATGMIWSRCTSN